jgi:hypothetical protein
MRLVVLIVFLGLLGAGLTTGGVFVLFGLGWALLAAGAFALIAAAICRNGLTPHG